MFTDFYTKSIEEAVEFQANALKGVKTLMSMSKEDFASGQLEKEPLFSISKMTLYRYKPLATKAKRVAMPLLITYALVNKQYMMDLQPDRSFIKSLLEAGLDVYIIDWGYPTAEDLYMTMDDHINWYMDACVDYIRKTSGFDKINLLGVCQGGTFSTIYTSMHQDKVNALVDMVTPIDFSPNDALLFAWSKPMSIDALVDAYGVIPGDLMNIAYLLLKPLTLTVDKYVNFAGNKRAEDPAYLSNFVRMEAWNFDSPSQEGETIRQFINDLYKANKFVKGELELGGKRADPKNITCPVLSVCGEQDHLVPLSSSRTLMDIIGSTDKTFSVFPVGHIGIFVGGKSQKEITPHITQWLTAKSPK